MHPMSQTQPQLKVQHKSVNRNKSTPVVPPQFAFVSVTWPWRCMGPPGARSLFVHVSFDVHQAPSGGDAQDEREDEGILAFKNKTAEEQKSALLWAMLIPCVAAAAACVGGCSDTSRRYFPNDVKSLESSFVRHVEYSLARRRENCDNQAAFHALALSVALPAHGCVGVLTGSPPGARALAGALEGHARVLLPEGLQARGVPVDGVPAGTLAAERGVQPGTARFTLLLLFGGVVTAAPDNYAEAMRNLGFRLEDLIEEENDAGLGNGACAGM